MPVHFCFIGERVGPGIDAPGAERSFKMRKRPLVYGKPQSVQKLQAASSKRTILGIWRSISAEDAIHRVGCSTSFSSRKAHNDVRLQQREDKNCRKKESYRDSVVDGREKKRGTRLEK